MERVKPKTADEQEKKAWGYPFSQEDWEKTPTAVQEYTLVRDRLLQEAQKKMAELLKRVEKLEAKKRRNSSNSDQPPSSDNPFTKGKKGKKKKGKAGAKKGHKGHSQKLLPPTQVENVQPAVCTCGCNTFLDLVDFQTHQHIELPEIKMEVLHFILQKGRCASCGKVNKAQVPQEFQTGYGPRLSATIAQMAGANGDSRSITQEFCSSVLGFHISLGAIQKVIDRASEAIKPHYDKIGEAARSSKVNHVDETSHRKTGHLQWLWVMANLTVAFFMIHPHRSKEAFEALVQDWVGILISDGYALYRKWVGDRQTCLAHLIRAAKAVSESTDPQMARVGKWALSELRRLCHMAHDRPTVGQWRAFYARLMRLIALHSGREDDAGKLVRRIQREMGALWLFLIEEGVSPTNNHAERMLRFAVLWRKRSQGTGSEKGNRWVERILTLRQTCKLRSLRIYPILVDALACHFKQQDPDLEWITNPS